MIYISIRLTVLWLRSNMVASTGPFLNLGFVETNANSSKLCFINTLALEAWRPNPPPICWITVNLLCSAIGGEHPPNFLKIKITTYTGNLFMPIS
jgi:hypothetical protein